MVFVETRLELGFTEETYADFGMLVGGVVTMPELFFHVPVPG